MEDRPISLPDSGTPLAVEKSLWDIKQAAVYFDVSESWIRRHLSDLPHSRHGRLIRFDPEGLKRTVVGRKSLEPTKESIVVNRFQRGMVYLRGKKKMWYGRFRLETLNAKGEREIWNRPLGLKTELPTKFKAEEKLREIMDGVLKSGISTKVKLYSTLVEEWKATEGMTLGTSTLNNYSNALRACVVPTFGSVDIRTITRKSIQDFLVEQAKKYGQSTLKTMRLVCV